MKMLFQKSLLTFLLALTCVFGCMKLLAGPKVYASAAGMSSISALQKMVVTSPDTDDGDGDFDDSSFDVSDAEDFAVLPAPLSLILYPPVKIFVRQIPVPSYVDSSVELPPPKV